MSGYSEAKCKYCGDKILWSNSFRYVDEDGKWRNQRLPRNCNGGEHHCERKRDWVLARQAALPAVGV